MSGRMTATGKKRSPAQSRRSFALEKGNDAAGGKDRPGGNGAAVAVLQMTVFQLNTGEHLLGGAERRIRGSAAFDPGLAANAVTRHNAWQVYHGGHDE